MIPEKNIKAKKISEGPAGVFKDRNTFHKDKYSDYRQWVIKV